jgi:hypothetical protein
MGDDRRKRIKNSEQKLRLLEAVDERARAGKPRRGILLLFDRERPDADAGARDEPLARDSE